MKNKLSIILNLRLLLFLTIFFHDILIFAGLENAGQARVLHVMHTGPGGIEQVNRKVSFARTKNLSADLNLQEISTRFGCKTKMGQGFIEYALAKPIASFDTQDTIKNRQNLIQLYIDYPELQAKLERLLAQAAEHEAVVMQFMDKRFVLSEPNINSFGDAVTFVQRSMDRSWLWQSMNLWVNSTTVGKGTVAGTNTAWNSLLDAYKYGSSVVHDPNSNVLYDAGAMVKAGAIGVGTGFLDTILVSLNLKEESPNFILNTYKVFMFAMAAKSLYDTHMRAIHARDSLYALNRLINIAQQIEDICREHGVDHQFKVSSICSFEGRNLLESLQQSRYQNKDSHFILTPAVQTFVYDVYEQDANLAPVYASIAEIDAYLAIAKKMSALENEDYKLSFSQFIDSPKPKIDAQSFWNMLVSQGRVVTNSIAEDRNIILTGANEGGKTTAIRAILQNIVLAQTFGIAAASEFKLTQFDVIHSYLNVSDDILHGKSRFAVELQQAQNILLQIKSLQPDEKFFFAFDELFTGTNGEDGAATAYDFINNIASYKGIQFIYATHFNKLKTIGANNPACVNYKIDPPLRNAQGKFIRDRENQLIYPYTLSLGANEVNVALERARDAGIFA